MIKIEMNIFIFLFIKNGVAISPGVAITSGFAITSGVAI
jgi:hypothetical protein